MGGLAAASPSTDMSIAATIAAWAAVLAAASMATALDTRLDSTSPRCRTAFHPSTALRAGLTLRITASAHPDGVSNVWPVVVSWHGC